MVFLKQVTKCRKLSKNFAPHFGPGYASLNFHKQHIQHPEYRKIPLSAHLDICGNGHFSGIPLNKLYTENVLERREKEKYFIQFLTPTLGRQHHSGRSHVQQHTGAWEPQPRCSL
jgi:hypothetical protein